jgi:hypothetical protein
MALLQCQSLPGIGCNGIAPARARVQQCLAAASHAPLPPPLLRANGGTTGRSPASVKAGSAIGFGRRGRRDLRVVAEAAAAKVTPVSPGGVSVSDVLWPSAGEFQALWSDVAMAHGPWPMATAPDSFSSFGNLGGVLFYFHSAMRSAADWSWPRPGFAGFV